MPATKLIKFWRTLSASRSSTNAEPSQKLLVSPPLGSRPTELYSQQKWNLKDTDWEVWPQRVPVGIDWVKKTVGATTHFRRIAIVDTSRVDPATAKILKSIAHNLTETLGKEDRDRDPLLDPDQIVLETHNATGIKNITENSQPLQSYVKSTIEMWNTQIGAKGLGDRLTARPLIYQEVRDIFGEKVEPLSEEKPSTPRLYIYGLSLKEDGSKMTSTSESLRKEGWFTDESWKIDQGKFDRAMSIASLMVDTVSAISGFMP